ncbi:hypothetical protein NDU88_003018 [Pleurodeles waltl]|uniref:Uncharacterized protein n=1 Tax=Pleurodeles waltl TaxID=8319 RepID=A0AAV7M2Q6_PLEWA|nr:hypothetical protein NDU88_003018 [Pleurodeles waltl]
MGLLLGRALPGHVFGHVPRCGEAFLIKSARSARIWVASPSGAREFWGLKSCPWLRLKMLAAPQSGLADWERLLGANPGGYAPWE